MERTHGRPYMCFACVVAHVQSSLCWTLRGSVQSPPSGTSTWLGWTRHYKTKCVDVTRGVQGECHRSAGDGGISYCWGLKDSTANKQASEDEKEAVPCVQLMVRPWKQLSESQRWASLPGPLPLL